MSRWSARKPIAVNGHQIGAYLVTPTGEPVARFMDLALARQVAAAMNLTSKKMRIAEVSRLHNEKPRGLGPGVK